MKQPLTRTYIHALILHLTMHHTCLHTVHSVHSEWHTHGAASQKAKSRAINKAQYIGALTHLQLLGCGHSRTGRGPMGTQCWQSGRQLLALLGAPVDEVTERETVPVTPHPRCTPISSNVRGTIQFTTTPERCL